MSLSGFLPYAALGSAAVVLSASPVWGAKGRVSKADAACKRIEKQLYARKFRALETRAKKLRNPPRRDADERFTLAFFYGCLAPYHKQHPISKMDKHRSLIKAWMAADPNSGTARIAMADLLRSYAWAYRGGGYAGEVRDGKWPEFKEMSEAGFQILNELHEKKFRDPHLYASLIFAARETDRSSRVDEFFQLGQEVDPRYTYLYTARANAAQERWGGAPGEIKKIAEIAARATGDGSPNMFYARAVFVGKWSNPYIFHRDTQVDWEPLSAGIKDWIRQVPDSMLAKHFHAWAACGYRKQAVAKKAFVGLTFGDGTSKDVWGKLAPYFNGCRWWALDVKGTVSAEDPKAWCADRDISDALSEAFTMCMWGGLNMGQTDPVDFVMEPLGPPAALGERQAIRVEILNREDKYLRQCLEVERTRPKSVRGVSIQGACKMTGAMGRRGR